MIFQKKGSAPAWLVAGLGNPGLQYAETRHNVGFMAVDRLAGEHPVWKHRFEAEFCDITLAGQRVLLCKPQTFMNLSGKAIQPLAAYYKIPVRNILILCDDISLPVGRIRLRRKGSAGGHNGLKDIFELLGSEEIARIKIGVGQKPHPDYDLKDWVLGKFPPSDRPALNDALNRAAAAVTELLQNGMDSAMNRYSS